MKEVYRDDLMEVVAYSGFKDYFGNAMYIVEDGMFNTIRLAGKNKGYKKERKWLDAHGHKNVYTPKYGEVIDISKSTLEKIKENFPDYKLPIYRWQVWE